MTEWLLLVVGVLLVLACAGFVAFEFSLVTVDRATVEREAEAGSRRAGTALAALRTLSTQLSGAQLGITVTNLAMPRGAGRGDPGRRAPLTPLGGGGRSRMGA